jgi:hypothetical protein
VLAESLGADLVLVRLSEARLRVWLQRKLLSTVLTIEAEAECRLEVERLLAKHDSSSFQVSSSSSSSAAAGVAAASSSSSSGTPKTASRGTIVEAARMLSRYLSDIHCQVLCEAVTAAYPGQPPLDWRFVTGMIAQDKGSSSSAPDLPVESSGSVNDVSRFVNPKPVLPESAASRAPKRKAPNPSPAAKRLAQVDKTGMKSITSMFAKQSK